MIPYTPPASWRTRSWITPYRAKPRISKYMPHQGKHEKARRIRHAAKVKP